MIPLSHMITQRFALTSKLLNTIKSSSSSSSSPLSSFVDLKPLDSKINPFECIEEELSALEDNIKHLIESHNNHPILDIASKYYFNKSGKHIRPAFVLLIGKCLAENKLNSTKIDSVLDQSDIDKLNCSPLDANFSEFNRLAYNHALSNSEEAYNRLNQSQIRLSEITEMIHTASLIHDDILDDADLRRGTDSLNSILGNKRAVLAGDYLLAKASISLARLHHVEVIELLSTTISDLVRGEFLQMNSQGSQGEYGDFGIDEPLNFNSPYQFGPLFNSYLEKTYLKTASLIANSCGASALLGGASEKDVSAAFNFGKNVGIAFQLIDDSLDFTSTEKELGKPVAADLKNGIITAPILFALEEAPDAITPLMERKFSVDGDIERCVDIVRTKTKGLQKTLELAEKHSLSARTAISQWDHSIYRDSLLVLVEKVLNRKS